MEDLLKLTVEERILLFGLFPQQSDYETLVAFKKLEKELRFNEEESRKFDIDQVVVDGQQQVKFNKEVTTGYLVDIQVPHRALSYFSEKLSEMSDKKVLSYPHIQLYEKFVLGEVNADTSKQGKGNNKK